ncbi:hypothetical protein [Taibaiella soli]|uniref:Uncharacterized protein n=1 Tax=Taibaiella soli TaxID=1649169 RepID=A0A2W2AY94_9BACT|nr:hypothetical protein [Taibaiella soli]PZF72658.1 hypothetical protein DN068_12395 [Taibaiella soli]
MPGTNSETGHYKNVANFQGLIHFCESLGTAYQPSRPDMIIPQLKEYYNKAVAIMEQVTNAEIMQSQSRQNRNNLFEDTKKLAARASNTLEIANPASTAIKTSKYYIAKIRGRRLGVVTPGTEATKAEDAPKTRSVSQTSYDATITHFEKLIGAILTEPGYAPNEADITISGLQKRLAELKEVNQETVRVTGQLKLLISQRDQMLYTPMTGLNAVALSVKQYIKVVYGAGSNELRAANMFSFRKVGN